MFVPILNFDYTKRYEENHDIQFHYLTLSSKYVYKVFIESSEILKLLIYFEHCSSSVLKGKKYHTKDTECTIRLKSFTNVTSSE